MKPIENLWDELEWQLQEKNNMSMTYITNFSSIDMKYQRLSVRIV